MKPLKHSPKYQLYTQQEIEADNKAMWLFNLLAILVGLILFLVVHFI